MTSESSGTSCLNFVGIILIALPIIVFQLVPTNPFGLFESDNDNNDNEFWTRTTYLHYIVIPCGAIGGILFSKTSSSSPRRDIGYVWIGGLLFGIITAIVAFIMSKQIYDDTSSTDINFFPFIYGAVPGFIVYSMVKRCSNYTFPVNTYNDMSYYQPLPTTSNYSTASNENHNHHNSKSSYQNNYSTTASSGGGSLSYETLSNM